MYSVMWKKLELTDQHSPIHNEINSIQGHVTL